VSELEREQAVAVEVLVRELRQRGARLVRNHPGQDQARVIAQVGEVALVADETIIAGLEPLLEPLHELIGWWIAGEVMRDMDEAQLLPESWMPILADCDLATIDWMLSPLKDSA